MKTLILALFLSQSALAQFVAPLIEKTNVSGFAPKEHQFFEDCKVYQDGVFIKRSHSEKSHTNFIPHEFKENIPELIQQARLEEAVSFALRRCDAPETTIMAQDLELYQSGSCETSKVQRKGPATDMLIKLVDEFCPTTF